jgi:glycosyltransferase involved in cell wall biosynthesis
VNVLVLCARFPERGRNGDQGRVREQVELLSAAHEVTVLTAGQPSSGAVRRELEGFASVRIVAAGWLRRAVAALAAGVRARPLQVGWMTPRKLWREAVHAAERCDVVLVSTIRCLPGALPAPTVLDHIDALSANMRERAGLERNPALRLGAHLDAHLLGAHEARAARWVAAQTVITSREADALPASPPPIVVPPAWIGPSAAAHAAQRDIDVILTGNMRYSPNRDAARWLVGEIVPRLRERHPEVRVVVAGRAAGALRLSGVVVLSDVPDLAELLTRSKVAAVPLRAGTGAPTKLFEALACGAAVVSTPWVARAVDLDIDTADDAPRFALALASLVTDETLRVRRAAAAGAGLAARRPAAIRDLLARVLADAARTPV